jgi:hypothetical protein
MMNWKGSGRKWSWQNCTAMSRNLPGRTEKKHEQLSENSRSTGRDLNPGLPEYEAEVLATQPQSSVFPHTETTVFNTQFNRNMLSAQIRNTRT